LVSTFQELAGCVLFPKHPPPRHLTEFSSIILVGIYSKEKTNGSQFEKQSTGRPDLLSGAPFGLCDLSHAGIQSTGYSSLDG